MARNKMQFQGELSEPEFESLYGSEERCSTVLKSCPASCSVMRLSRFTAPPSCSRNG